MPSTPIFLLGSPRSGTTLLRLLLTAHPDIVIAPESSFLTWFLPTYGDWSLTDCESPRRSAFVTDLMAARKFETWGLEADAIDARIRTDQPATYAELATIPYLLYGESLGKPRAQWGDKNNVHMEFVPEINALFPTSRFVHIVRDVRDCFVSSNDIHSLDSTSPYKPNLSLDATEFGRGWNDQNERALAALSELAEDRWTTVRYEDLVVDPHEALAGVLDRWGYGWVDEMLGFHEANRRQQLEPVETSDWKKLVSEPVTDSQVGRFRHSLSVDQIDALTVAAAPMLEAFRYLDGDGGDR